MPKLRRNSSDYLIIISSLIIGTDFLNYIQKVLMKKYAI